MTHNFWAVTVYEKYKVFTVKLKRFGILSSIDIIVSGLSKLSLYSNDDVN